MKPILKQNCVKIETDTGFYFCYSFYTKGKNRRGGYAQFTQKPIRKGHIVVLTDFIDKCFYYRILERRFVNPCRKF